MRRSYALRRPLVLFGENKEVIWKGLDHYQEFLTVVQLSDICVKHQDLFVYMAIETRVSILRSSG